VQEVDGSPELADLGRLTVESHFLVGGIVQDRRERRDHRLER